MTEPKGLELRVTRWIPASPGTLFEAWTSPEQLLVWWGPQGVQCSDAEVELRTGGKFRIGNLLPDGRVVYITGEFIAVDPPHRLQYTWRLGSEAADPEQVTVFFDAKDGGTEVVVFHERIADDRARKEHTLGWNGCLQGLADHVQ